MSKGNTISLSKKFIGKQMFALSDTALRMYLWLRFWQTRPKYRVTTRDKITQSNKRRRGLLLSDRELCYHLEMIHPATGEFLVREMLEARQALESHGLLVFDRDTSFILNDDPRGFYRTK